MFDAGSYRPFVGPKLVVALLLGSLAAPALIAGGGMGRIGRPALAAFGVHLVALVLATVLSLAPLVSLAGDPWRGMGLATRLALILLALAAGSAAAARRENFSWLLRAVVATCAIVALYAIAQALRIDPVLDPALLEETNRAGATELRVVSTLGHANFAGHLLLFGTGAAVALLGLERTVAARAAAVAGGALSGLGVVVSGARGAWVGLAVQAAVALALAPRCFGRIVFARRGLIGGGVAATLALGAVLLAAGGPIAGQVLARAHAFRADGMTGSGRTLLWNDALPMLARYWAHGTGPDAFALAFLPYQSGDLTRAEPHALYDSAHNLALDAALTAGLAGAASFMLLLAASFALLLARARSAAPGAGRAAPLGLGLGLLGYLVHGLFIFDTIAAAFYFYLFVALAGVPPGGAAERSAGSGSRWRGAIAVSLVLVAAGVLWPRLWYAWRSDRQMAAALDFAAEGRLPLAIAHGRAAIENGRALGPASELRRLLVRIYARAGNPYGHPPSGDERTLLEEGRREAGRALVGSTSPHLLLVEEADLARRLGDDEAALERLRAAVALAPAFWHARVRLAELLHARGDEEGARREAERALELNPESEAARAVYEASGAGG